MPPLLPLAVYAAAALVALGSAVYVSDQQDKREQDQARHREELEALVKRLARMEREFWKLRRRLGRKCRQVRELAQQVLELKQKIARLREALASHRLERLREELAKRSWQDAG